jgi:hypothetical protein
MNKNDCTNIGYILSEYKLSEDLCNEFFKLDKRIEENYIGFLEARGISEKVDEIALKLMIKANGYNWATKKRETLTRTYGDCLKEARKQIYGQ